MGFIKYTAKYFVLFILLVFIGYVFITKFLIVYQYNNQYGFIGELNVKFADFSSRFDLNLDKKSHRVIDKMHKLVHMDLKGSPPKANFFKEMISYFKTIGATGLLIEYEDMFPYENDLKIIRNLNAYTKSELDEILKAAKDNGLLVIPLIQTYGHLEFVLKLDEFKYLREVEKHFQVITPCIQDTYEKVLYPMIDQIIDFHMKYDLKYIHIGCDEVYHIGKNPACKAKNASVLDYFVNHVSKLVTRIKQKDSNLNVIIWDDVLRHNIQVLDAPLTNFAKTVQPMVWDYGDRHNVSEHEWNIYSSIFDRIWAASSFKGATNQLAYMPNTTKHFMNHLEWLKVINKIEKKGLKFNGIALTGWSRYDHMQGICETLPSAIPSLVLCLQTINNYGDFQKAIAKTIEFTHCLNSTHTYGFPFEPILINSVENATLCQFPGTSMYVPIARLYKQISGMVKNHESFYSNILNDYNLGNGYINSMVYENALNETYPMFEKTLNEFIPVISDTFKQFYYNDLANEFIELYIKRFYNKTQEMLVKLRNFRYKKFNVRPYIN